jgi:hypothetical protein
MGTYRHTQTAPIWLILVAFVPALVAGALAADAMALRAILLIAAAVFLLLAACFRSLTVEDGGDHLVVRYGPLPLFQKRFAYADMADVAAGRSRTIDGWGIHYVPGRGWTYNLWGYECVELRYRGVLLRIGSDEAGNLARFLHERLAVR